MTTVVTNIIRQIQDHLCDGVVIIVGSGLSIAEGLPGMYDLSISLRKHMQDFMRSAPDPEWFKVEKALDVGLHLEAAMSEAALTEKTFEEVV